MDSIHKFLSQPNILVDHHLSSFNMFLEKIPSILHQKNPRVIFKKMVEGEFKHECNMYVGGRDGTEIIKGRPFFYENGIKKVMYPNDARLRNMTYGFSLLAKLLFVIKIEGVITEEFTTNYVFIGNFPIMLHSDMCVLKNMPEDVLFTMGECPRDPGGYFVVDGSEKVIVCQENRANNTICVLKKYSDKYYYRAEIKSESEDDSKLARITAVQISTREDPLSRVNKDGVSLHEMVVDLPDVRAPIPLFIVMRALGVLSDNRIIQTCLLGEYPHFVEYFRECVYDAGGIFTQQTALEYIGYFTKYQTSEYALRVLTELTLPHIGETNFIDKAYFLGHMVTKLLRVATHVDAPTDRDSFMYKRINTTGILLTNLFKDFYEKQMKHVGLMIDRTYSQNIQLYDDPAVFSQLFKMNFETFFEERITETGFIKAFKGDWGATEYSKREGVSQKLNRLSYNSAMTHLRKCVLQLDDSAKVVAPHLLNSSQWGIFDPVDTPDGGDIGTHKHLSLCAKITDATPRQPILDALTSLGIRIHLLEHTPYHNLSIYVKLFINGNWCGSVDDPQEVMLSLKENRREGKIPASTSISWNIQENIIYIYTDAGRVQRPLYYVKLNKKISYVPGKTWKEMVTGTPGSPSVIEYLDCDELNTSMITFDKYMDFEDTQYTHVELHAASLFGFMGNHIIFPENSPLPRNCFSCSQSKQAVSVYNTNYQNRMDTMGVVLNYGQQPLIQSSFFKPFKSLPYGVNAMVAIMAYTGYNTEDAILINKSSLDRGMFNTSYFKTYETEEKTSMNSDGKLVFESGNNTDEHGLVPINTKVNKETILMRMIQQGKVKNIYPNADQVGRVDKTFISEGEPGHRVGKVRIVTERIPEIGDKFASRAGQKGTCGLILNEEDMPFTANGLRPDMIINPHAIPSRMTLGQLVECVMGKIHLQSGSLGDSTVFNKHSLDDYKREYTRTLNELGYHSSGCELLYNGMTGDQLQSDIFIGPTYYLRLKHMVSDKINFRPRGPNAALTRQPLQGRSNEGGLRIGEMERDGLVANGMTQFIRESMMTRGDGTTLLNNCRVPYTIHVDDSTGLTAIYNESAKLALSPSMEGVQFDGDQLSTIPKYSTTFSRLNVPYCFKLLMQELATMNVQMRLITSTQKDHRSTLRMNALLAETIIALFSKLSNELYRVLDNQLYVSSLKTTTLDLEFKHKGLLNTIFPFLSSRKEFDTLKYAATNIQAQKYTSKFHLERCALDIYRPAPTSFERTLSYMLDKMKTGIFVRIKNNKVFNFHPLYNIEYRNDFYTTISKKSMEEMFAVLKKNNPGRFRNSSQDPSAWHATDCLIRTEKVDNAPTDAYLSEMYDMLVNTCSHRKVNDCIFFITRKDFPHLRKDWKEAFSSLYGDKALPEPFLNQPFIPVVSQSTTVDHADFPMPTGDDWKMICSNSYFASTKYNYRDNTSETVWGNSSTPRTDLPPWEKRQSVVIWRGQGTGCGNDSTTNPRMKLNELTEAGLAGLDARIMRYTERIKARFESGEVHVDYKPTVDVKKYEMPMTEQLKNKFVINVEGNSAAYRFGSLLGLGFCVLNVQSKYTLWFEPMIKILSVDDPDIENAHCILVQHDLSDLEKTIQWCFAHDAICERIKNNAMDFYQRHFTKEFVYDYMADLCNSISNQLTDQPDYFKEVSALVPKKEMRFLRYTQKDNLPHENSVIIVPFRDSGNQNRGEQLKEFLKHYDMMNILVVEQTEGDKFNRGALLNIGYEYIVKHLPEVNTFIFQDVDIILDKGIVQKYYGYDDKPLVHMGDIIKGEKYKGAVNFLGRILRASKQAYHDLNGFPNTFYGWGGEDDALANRIHQTHAVIYRPSEREVGYELATKNDILYDKTSEAKEKHKLEELVSDTLMWKINGLNSLQYAVVENVPLGEKSRKITVQLSPYEEYVQPTKMPVKKQVKEVNPELEVLEVPETSVIESSDVKKIELSK